VETAFVLLSSVLRQSNFPSISRKRGNDNMLKKWARRFLTMVLNFLDNNKRINLKFEIFREGNKIPRSRAESALRDVVVIVNAEVPDDDVLGRMTDIE
jgi:hypothetical protein